MTRRRGFTLLEMLLAVVLSAMLMAAVLVVLGGVARDRRVLRSVNASTGHEVLLGQLRWDLLNARTMSVAEDGNTLTLVGNGALDRRLLAPTNRLAAVTYRRDADGKLVREQEALDDPTQAARWRETVAWRVAEFSVTPLDADAFAGVASAVPPRVRVRLDADGGAVEQEMWLK
jgi:prepilin-type N-terminal cleavage/methylation domain-containing protein